MTVGHAPLTRARLGGQHDRVTDKSSLLEVRASGVGQGWEWGDGMEGGQVVCPVPVEVPESRFRGHLLSVPWGLPLMHSSPRCTWCACASSNGSFAVHWGVLSSLKPETNFEWKKDYPKGTVGSVPKPTKHVCVTRSDHNLVGLSGRWQRADPPWEEE